MYPYYNMSEHKIVHNKSRELHEKRIIFRRVNGVGSCRESLESYETLYINILND